MHCSGSVMSRQFTTARSMVREGGKARIVFSEGEEERVLRAVQIVLDENLAKPILIGRPKVLESRIKRFGLRIKLGEDVEVTNPEWDDRFHKYWTTYWEIMCRRGMTQEMARVEMGCRLPLIQAWI